MREINTSICKILLVLHFTTAVKQRASPLGGTTRRRNHMEITATVIIHCSRNSRS